MKTSANHKLQGHSIGMIVLLAVQYILGMLANIYVAFPETMSVVKHWDYARGQWLVLTHILIGTLLVFGTVALYIRAINLKDKTWKIASGIAAGSVILAWVCGEEFISSQSEIYSFVMSLFFLVALLALGWGTYESRQK